VADTLTRKAVAFIEANRGRPFFPRFSTHDIHVPRVPYARLAGKGRCGVGCDALLERNWCVGELVRTLERLDLARRSRVIFSSDNGPVVDDGYQDGAVETLGDHRPAGPWRGGKYSNFEGGTRVPFITWWPGRVRPRVSDALISQVDLLATLAALAGEKLAGRAGPDSFNLLPALLGDSTAGRDHLVVHAGSLSLRRGRWKLILPSSGPAFNKNANIELGNAPEPQLYDLARDPGETRNLAPFEPALVQELTEQLERIRASGRSRPPT
jgi:arylsulfatase A-like enzyme